MVELQIAYVLPVVNSHFPEVTALPVVLGSTHSKDTLCNLLLPVSPLLLLSRVFLLDSES